MEYEAQQMNPAPMDTESAALRSPISWVWRIAAFAMLLCAATSMFVPLDRINKRVAHDYNEGWNAFFSERAWGEGDLYPDPSGLVINNYPPLSFFLIGGVGVLTGDQILAGRWVSLFALLFVAASIAFIVAREVQQRALGLFMGALFTAIFATHFDGYVAMNDPQITAHALAMLGLLALLYGRSPIVSVVIAAAFMLAAGFIKHNLLPLPIATTIWLLMYDRKRLLGWVTASALITAVAFGVSYAAFGQNFVKSLFGHARLFGLDVLAANTARSLTPMALLIVIPVIAFITGDRRQQAVLFVLYLLAALFFGALASGGEGVDCNAFFDLLIAACLATGLTVGRVVNSIRTNPSWGPSLALASALAMPLLISLPANYYSARRKQVELGWLVAANTADIAYIASFDGPMMIESLALKYWASKPMEVDWFNVGQAMKKGRLDESSIIDQIDRRSFVLIYTDYKGGQSGRFPAKVNAAIAQNYRVDRTGPMFGAFLVPRELPLDRAQAEE